MNKELDLFSLDSEQSIIGSILLNDTKSMMCIKRMKALSDWFAVPECKLLFELLCKMNKAEQPVDITTAAVAMKQNKATKNIGGQLFLDKIIDKTITAAHIEFHLEKVKDYWGKRCLLETLDNSYNALETEDTHIDIICNINEQIKGIITAETDDFDPERVRNKIKERHAHAQEKGYTGIATRWMQVQQILGGYRRGKICVIAARPSIGKTTYVLNDIRFQAEQFKTKIFMASMETDEEEIYEQLAAEKVGLDLHKYYNGESISSQKMEEFENSIDDMLKLPLYVSDKNMDIDHLCNTIQYMVYKKGIELVYIDYMQIISDSKKTLGMHSNKDRISYFSKQIFEITRKTNVATVLLSQLNRNGEIPKNVKGLDRWKYIPRLSDLKESGKIEEDAYQAILLSPDPMETDPESIMNCGLLVDVAKNKRGPRKKIMLLHKKQKQRIDANVIGGF